VRNRKLIQVFLTLLEDVNKEMPEDSKIGFFAIPLHRVFSYYLSRLVMQNYLAEIGQWTAAGKPARDLFREIIKRFVVTPPG
jgi:mannosyltransferase OCH1-like enzyme